MVVCHGRVLEEAPVEGVPQRRLRHAVEVDVVLANELVDLGVVGAPPVAPVVGREARAAVLLVKGKRGLCEADGRPEALGPAPHGQAARVLKRGRGHAPLDVAGDAEGQKRLARAEAHSGGLEDRACVVAVMPVGKLDGEGLLALLGLVELVGGELVLDRVEALAELVLDVDHGRDESLAHGLGHDGPHLRVDVPLVHELLELGLEGGQVEVPVVNGAQLGRGAGERRDGADELLGVKLVAQVALVGIGLLGLAPAHGAATDDLAPIEELAGFDVVELAGAQLVQEAALVEAA